MHLSFKKYQKKMIAICHTKQAQMSKTLKNINTSTAYFSSNATIISNYLLPNQLKLYSSTYFLAVVSFSNLLGITVLLNESSVGILHPQYLHTTTTFPI